MPAEREDAGEDMAFWIGDRVGVRVDASVVVALQGRSPGIGVGTAYPRPIVRTAGISPGSIGGGGDAVGAEAEGIEEKVVGGVGEAGDTPSLAGGEDSISVGSSIGEA